MVMSFVMSTEISLVCIVRQATASQTPEEEADGKKYYINEEKLHLHTALPSELFEI